MEYREKYEESGWDFESLEILDSESNIIFCIVVHRDCPEDLTMYRDLRDCRKIADLLNAAYAKGFEAGSR
jgi:hypothetical protein